MVAGWLQSTKLQKAANANHLIFLVEPRGIEPLTSSLRTSLREMRSPNDSIITSDYQEACYPQTLTRTEVVDTIPRSSPQEPQFMRGGRQDVRNRTGESE
jgi:hypothetical protein